MTHLSRRTVLIASGAATVAGASAGAAVFGAGFAPTEYEPSPVFTDDGRAIRGYDPVAYFKERRPVKGLDAFSAAWNGASWRFATAENRDAFEAEPTAYAPRYGGFCAWAVAAKGELYSTQPSNWTIVDGKLYLNYNDDIQKRWEQDIPGFIAKADRRWPQIVADA